MEYRTAAFDMADEIYNVLHTTIKTVYPKYYPARVADFFCRLHSREHILEGIASGNMGVLVTGGVVVGTGCMITTILQGSMCCPGIRGRDAVHRF